MAFPVLLMLSAERDEYLTQRQPAKPLLSRNPAYCRSTLFQLSKRILS